MREGNNLDHTHMRKDNDPRQLDYTHEREDNDPLQLDHTHKMEDVDPLQLDYTHEREDNDPRQLDYTHEREDIDTLQLAHTHKREDNDPRQLAHTHEREDNDPRQLDYTHEREDIDPLQIVAVNEEGEDAVALRVGAEVIAEMAVKVSMEMGSELDAGNADNAEKKEEETSCPLWSVFDDDGNTSTFDDISDCVSELLHDHTCAVTCKTLETNQFIITTKTQATARKQMVDEALSSSESRDEERTGKMVGGAGETTGTHHKETNIHGGNSAATQCNPVPTKDDSDGDERVNGSFLFPKQDIAAGEEIEQDAGSQSTQRDLGNMTTSLDLVSLFDFDSAESETTENGSEM